MCRSSLTSADGKGWFGGWFGGKKKDDGEKKYTRANLGEEQSMVYDPEQKRWVVKGAKAEPAPAPAPPPPRAKTASPAGARPPAAGTPPPGSAPPSRLSMGSGHPPSSLSMGTTAPPPGAGGAPPRPPQSTTPGAPPPSSSVPPSGRPKPVPGASLDDLLSRPSSGRPSSAAAKKKARGKYVDVFQG